MNLFSELLPFNLPNTKEYTSTFNNDLNGFDIFIPNGKLFYSENFFNKKISDRSIKYFLENNTNNWEETNWRDFDKEKLSQVKFKNIKWSHDKILMFGKQTFLPRYSAWYGDDDKPYTYSNLTLQPQKWNKGLEYIKNEVNKAVSVKFNSVLMNWYRDGQDYINWHSDEEKELGKNPVIASVNFGETRDFIIRNNLDKSKKITIPLRHGTLLVMSGALQHFWQHSLPKRKNINNSRVNLTFRVIHKR